MSSSHSFHCAPEAPKVVAYPEPGYAVVRFEFKGDCTSTDIVLFVPANGLTAYADVFARIAAGFRAMAPTESVEA